MHLYFSIGKGHPGKQHCAYCIGTLSFPIAVAGAPDDVNKACGGIECLQFSTEAVQRQFSVADRGRSPFQMAGMCRPNVSVFLRGTAMSGLVLAVKVFSPQHVNWTSLLEFGNWSLH